MDIKSKNFLTNNSKVKYISLGLLILFTSALFETLFNLIFSFRGSNMYNYVSIPRYYFFGSVNTVWGSELKDDYIIIAIILSIITLIFAGLYYINRYTSKKLELKIESLTNNRSLETILILVVVLVVIRYFVWGNTLDFFDNILIIINTIILSLVYIIINYINFNKENLDKKSFVYRFIKGFINKQNRKSLNKKIATWFILAIILNFTLVSVVFIQIFGFYYNASPFIYSFIGTLPIAISLAIIYRKLSRKLSYVDYISYNVKNIEEGNLKYQLDVKGNDEISNLALSINNITNGLDIALENQIKSEKMKTELITNVSHDLKTPLTSIVNYVDILKKQRIR